MRIKPINEYVFVKQLPPDKESGGIIIPDTVQKKPSRGVIAAISDKVEGYSVGDDVIFADGSGQQIQVDGIEYLILTPDDIFGKITKK